jgi:hypothetical protein
MKFEISRTSVWNIEVPPCDGAVKMETLRPDARHYGSPEEYDKAQARYSRFKPWMSEGKNHRIADGNIIRDFDWEAWFIELNSLEELMSFISSEGPCVILRGEINPSIEIYDDYRE